ncbi:hypothetical protein [Candidatus Pantoea bituminis]|uniref:hypothetical protein n=1 Tax=Candidatus Pantoea bituminis TaxID=2831036 RepID=UPI001C05F847|nr:hypothetical protein [Pantoea bituminis]
MGLKVEEFTQPSEFTLTYCDSRAGQVSSFVLIREFSEFKKQAKKGFATWQTPDYSGRN